MSWLSQIAELKKREAESSAKAVEAEQTTTMSIEILRGLNSLPVLPKIAGRSVDGHGAPV